MAHYYPNGESSHYDGLILAVARAAGEVAPLMLVGCCETGADTAYRHEFPICAFRA